MKYIFLSDVHGNIEAFDAVIGSFSKEGKFEVINGGDIVGYGADPEICIKKLISLGSKNVLGNHDAAVIGKIETCNFNDYAQKAVNWTRENLSTDGKDFLERLLFVVEEELFTIVHGTLHRPEKFNYMISGADAMHTFEILKTRLCFVGHSHLPGIFIFKNGRILASYKKKIVIEDGLKYIINVGSVGQPRDGDSRASYCIYDSEKKELELRRVEYDIDSARKKIIDAGLPRMLGDRLLIGR